MVEINKNKLVEEGALLRIPKQLVAFNFRFIVPKQKGRANKKPVHNEDGTRSNKEKVRLYE